MKKLTTISAVALLTFGVAACNKVDPAAEYKQFQEWQQSQETARAEAQAEFQQQLAQAQKDPKALETVLQNFAAKVQSTLNSLDSLNVKSEEIKGLKEKVRSVLSLSTELLTEQAKLLTTPSADAEKAIQEKTVKLTEEANALQKLQADLNAKFAK